MTSQPPIGSDRFDRALAAYEQELERPGHRTIDLVARVAATRETSIVVTAEAVEGIDFLVRCGLDHGLVVYLIMTELDHLEQASGLDYPEQAFNRPSGLDDDALFVDKRFRPPTDPS